jgi:hypothetical protein
MSFMDTLKKFAVSAAANADPELTLRMASSPPVQVYQTPDGKSRTRVGVTAWVSFDSPGDSDYTLAAMGNAVAGGNFFQSSDQQKKPSEEPSPQSNPSNS